MAMLIAWQTVNAVRRAGSKNFTRGFLVVAPGLTIKDRLRALQPNDPDSYYKDRDLLEEVRRAKIVITNFHAFKPRERLAISKGGRALLQGRTGTEIEKMAVTLSFQPRFFLRDVDQSDFCLEVMDSSFQKGLQKGASLPNLSSLGNLWSFGVIRLCRFRAFQIGHRNGHRHPELPLLS